MACPACSAKLPEGARFCPSCGHALTPKADERRVATVLFADLVGFTALSELADPEQLKNLVDHAFERLVTDLRVYGGRVDKIMGDAIIALFGAPIAHEDDPERAVRAAMQMQRTLSDFAAEVDLDLQMRIGVNSGEVLVGALRAGGDYTAMGDTVNVASRLQDAARPGQVLVGPATHAETREVIRYDTLGPIRARGRGELVDAYAALEAIGPPGHRPRRRRTPLVGRDSELAMLSLTAAMALDRSRPQVVVISGEAGIGKTRLADEVLRIAATDHNALVLEGRCVPYGEANVWFPIAVAVRQALGIEHGAPFEQVEQTMRTKVSAALDQPADSPEISRIVAGLLYLLGMQSSLSDLDAARAREHAERSAIGLLATVAKRRPVVLAISELHWADELVLDLLDRVPDELRSLPILVLATARSELDERWTPKAGRHGVVLLHLEALSREAVAELATVLMKAHPSPALVDLLYERSGGNPFFLEELAGLMGGNAPISELPATLRSLVATRLDALPPAERSLVNDAAVVGRLGSVTALGILADSHGEEGPSVMELVDHLVTQDLLAVDGRQWMFRSDLVREVAYETLSKAERARRHAALGSWLASEAAGAQADNLEQVAHHMGVAAEVVHELGPVPGVSPGIIEEAISWLQQAADQAARRKTPSLVIQLASRALELLPMDRTRERRQMRLLRAEALTTMRRAGAARPDLDVVLRGAAEDGDDHSRAEALTVLGQVEQNENDLTRSAATLDQAIELWQAVGDVAGEAGALRLRGMTDLFAGRHDSAEMFIRSALLRFRDLDDRRGAAWAHQNLAWISFNRGIAADAESQLQQSIRLFEEVGDWSGLGWAYGLLAWVRLQQGRIDDAEALAAQMPDVDHTGDPWAAGMMTMLRASTRLWRGNQEDAVELASEARQHFLQIGDRAGQLRAVSLLIRSLISAGRVQAAMEMLDSTRRMGEAGDEAPVPDPGSLATSIEIADGEQALAAVDGSFEEAGASRVERQVHIGLALLQVGRVDAAVARLTAAAEVARNAGARAAVGAALAFAKVVAGDADGARAAANAAHAMGDGTYLDANFVRYAHGFAALQLGEREEAARHLAEAVEVADATEDRLSQALTRLAHARLLEAAERPEAMEHLAEAHRRLEAIGLSTTDWDVVFQRAASVGAASPA